MSKKEKIYISNIMETHIHNNVTSFHMPGHKNNFIFAENENLLLYDYTEIIGFDNLQNPKDVIKNSLERISNIYKTKKSYILVNGSTIGILTSILSLCTKDDLLLISNDCHKSVFSAIELSNCDFSYIYKEKSSIDCFTDFNYSNLENQIVNIQKTRKIKAICITSPTYEGVLCDIKILSNLCKKNDILLIVDEAHGAHLNHNTELPKSSVLEGADIVIQSLHKTMPALTQSALLHVCSDKINLTKLEHTLNMLQTTSPSYIFMYTIDKLMENLSKLPFKEHIKNIKIFRKDFKELSNNDIMIIDKDFLKTNYFDSTKLIIFSKKLSGEQLHSILLKKYKLNFEMYTKNYVIGITTPLDDFKVYNKLKIALLEIENEYKNYPKINFFEASSTQKDFSIKKISNTDDYVLNSIEKSEGLLCFENIVPYPPGIPIVLKNELITKNTILEILSLKNKKIEIIGVYDYENEFKIKTKR
ncbi:MAG: aminotransferase class I/II-fold pyridoxal phosphate-dependent enzyme [Lachnospirales bacterium]